MKHTLNVKYINDVGVAWECTCGFISNVYPVMLEHFEEHEGDVSTTNLKMLKENVADNRVIILKDGTYT